MKRRHFIGTAGAGALSLSFPKSTGAADEAFPDLTFLVVTDTHLGHRTNGNAEKQWTQTASELAEAGGSLVLHLGDVVDRGQSELYEVYLRERAKIGKPIYEIAGNHDELEDFEKQLSVKGDRVISHGGISFILFTNARRTSHDGFVSRDQIRWIAEKCRAAAEAGKWIIFCAHVPFHDNFPPDRAWFVKPGDGQREFYEIVEEHKDRVLGAFHGHFHNGIRGWADKSPMHEITFPSALYNQDRGFKRARPPGYFVEELRPGFTKVRLQDRTMLLEYHVVGEGVTKEKELSYRLP